MHCENCSLGKCEHGCCGHNCRRTGKSWGMKFGVFLLVLGLFLFAKQLGFLPPDFSFWPILFVGFGVYILLDQSYGNKCHGQSGEVCKDGEGGVK